MRDPRRRRARGRNDVFSSRIQVPSEEKLTCFQEHDSVVLFAVNRYGD